MARCRPLLVHIADIFKREAWEEMGERRGVNGVVCYAIFRDRLLGDELTMVTAFGLVEYFIESRRSDRVSPGS